MCNRYVGDWRNGLRHGGGVFYYSNGSRFVQRKILCSLSAFVVGCEDF